MRLHHVLPWVLLGAGTVGAWLGCGSDDSGSDVTAQGDAGNASSSSGGTASSTSSSGGTSTSSSGGSTTGDGGGTSSSSGAPGGDGGINPPDAGPGGNTTQINCGATACPIPAQECCVAQTNAGRAYGCVSVDAGCGGGGGGDVAALQCTSQANCPANTVCCVSATNNGATSACQASCTGDQAQLCDPSATNTGCSAQDPCSHDNIGDWGLPRTFATCGGKGN